MMDRVRSEQEIEDAAQRVAQAREAQLDATAAPMSAMDLMARQAYLERSERAHQASRDDLQPSRPGSGGAPRGADRGRARPSGPGAPQGESPRRVVSVSRRASRPPTSTRSRSTASAGGQHEPRHRIGVADAGRHHRGALRRRGLERARYGRSPPGARWGGRHTARRGLSAPRGRPGDKSADRRRPADRRVRQRPVNQVARTALAEGQSKQTSTKGGKQNATDADASSFASGSNDSDGSAADGSVAGGDGSRPLIPPH